MASWRDYLFIADSRLVENLRTVDGVMTFGVMIVVVVVVIIIIVIELSSSPLLLSLSLLVPAVHVAVTAHSAGLLLRVPARLAAQLLRVAARPAAQLLRVPARPAAQLLRILDELAAAGDDVVPMAPLRRAVVDIVVPTRAPSFLVAAAVVASRRRHRRVEFPARTTVPAR